MLFSVFAGSLYKYQTNVLNFATTNTAIWVQCLCVQLPHTLAFSYPGQDTLERPFGPSQPNYSYLPNSREVLSVALTTDLIEMATMDRSFSALLLEDTA